MSLNCKGSGIEFGHLAEVFFTPTPALNMKLCIVIVSLNELTVLISNYCMDGAENDMRNYSGRGKSAPACKK